MATWLPVPQRRILLENISFVYAFGNTKWTSLFQDNGEAALKVRRPLRPTAFMCGA